jgi:hypothetical protein
MKFTRVIMVNLSTWWLTYPSEKYESQLGLLFPSEWKVIKNVPTTNQRVISIHNYNQIQLLIVDQIQILTINDNHI